MAGAAPKGAGSGRRRPPPPGLRALLLLLCLWLPSGRAAGPLPAPLSGVEQLLGEFRRQLQQERPQEELELELRAGGGPPPGCPGPGGGGYSAMPDAIIRTKDSIAAGASFLSAPAAVRDWRQCVAACCAEPRCSVAVVELPRRPAPPAAALGCYLFNCTARGRNVCRFALHRGYSSYSLGRALEGQRDLGAGFPATARASPRLGKQAPGRGRCSSCTCWVAASGRPARQDLWAPSPRKHLVPEKDEPPLSKAGEDVVVRLPTDGLVLDGRESTDDHAIVQYEWTLLQGDPSVDMKVPQSGTLKLSHLQEGRYTFQLTVTDTAGQRSADNVSVTVLPPAFSTRVSLDGKTETHTATSQPRNHSHEQRCSRTLPGDVSGSRCPTPATCVTRHGEESFRLLGTKDSNWPCDARAAFPPSHAAQRPSGWGGVERLQGGPLVLERRPLYLEPVLSLEKSKLSGVNFVSSLLLPVVGKLWLASNMRLFGPLSAVLPLTLGLAITALLLLMVACRLRLLKQKLKKARPITSEESDYLINGIEEERGRERIMMGCFLHAPDWGSSPQPRQVLRTESIPDLQVHRSTLNH
ncbi:hypothetical protein QTO34_001050 [Cnephaeus nilssonii]|uniref:Uncharacterized protein n=1 Tax=Cnephaeus nilssonii TaxID=3371016 RepID=A0AA40HW15_CNENI|nr:hypothetical protein QTO34_001050 [Eptesicus nilssonii]